MMDASTMICRSLDVDSSDVAGEIVLMAVHSDSYFGLNDVGSTIWRALASPMTLGALCDRLCALYSDDSELIRKQTSEYLEELVRQRLVLTGADATAVSG